MIYGLDGGSVNVDANRRRHSRHRKCSGQWFRRVVGDPSFVP